ncbi:EamA family transporter [Poseidonocella sp. HB161398]|uniref:EamA family transporter n=1 Tax=Poseidonocella sp. HB161398 TaxID=2320855 RepID=UPI001108FA33|nr:EamA family transporter [Poseidonocella sp. HB161398]
MEPHVFAAVLLAALLHAGWNALLKTGLDRASGVLLLALVQAAIALPLLPFMPLPAAAAWPWIAAGAGLHAGYKMMLARAYDAADLSQAYPLARGCAPLIVTAAAVLALGETPGPRVLAAIAAISLGILVMAARGGPAGRMEGRALAYAGATACFTAAYTLADGIGARIAGSAPAFVLWMALGDAVLMAAWAGARRGRAAFAVLRPAWRSGLAAGAMSLGSYGIAVWAFTRAPIAMVAALRESSILFAVVIAGLVLREPVGRWRWASAGAIACGVALMKG